MSSQNSRRRNRSEVLTKRNKRLRKETRVTPWRDEWELESVGRALLNVLQQDDSSGREDLMSIEEALEVVAVWKARSNAIDGLPHSVDCTASLAEIYWRDHNSHQSNLFTPSVTEIRLSYSAAIVRCINGFADMMQQQRFVAAPVSVLCAEMGIPTWLVDIRHEASHNALPTLGVLRLAASTLLEFLKSEYWIPTCPNWRSEVESEENELSNHKKQSTIYSNTKHALQHSIRQIVSRHPTLFPQI